MYPYMNEDVAWQRLQDVQREMENSRRWAAGERPDWYRKIVGAPAAVARLVAGMLTPGQVATAECDIVEGEAASDAA